MSKSSNKIIPTSLSVKDYIAQIEDHLRRAECQKLLSIMLQISGYEAKVWGEKLSSAIIGFGQYHYKYESGREGDSLRLGFASRAQNISVYIMPGYEGFEDELSRLGKYKLGKVCLSIKRLSDIDEVVLREICKKSLDIMARKYPLDA